MMGSSHALSGAVGWLGLCALAGPLTGFEPTVVMVAAGAAVGAGSAILPDVDHPSSTAARSLGPVTRAAARVVSYISDAVRDNTCGCCATTGTHGHRTLTHTLVFAILAGLGVCAAGWTWGLMSAAIVVGAGTGLAVLGLISGKGTWPAAAVAGTAAGVGVHWLGAGIDWWWLGIPVGWGMLSHSLGDGITKQAVPLLWPVRIGGCRWARVGPPEWLRFTTNGPAERWLVVPGMWLVGLAVGGWLLWDSGLTEVVEAGRDLYASLD